MKLPVLYLSGSALAVLTLASGCATTTETKRPTASRTTSTAAVAMNQAIPNEPAASTEPAGAGAAGALLDLTALSAKEATAARATERTLTLADYRTQLAHANEELKAHPKSGHALFERAKANSHLKNYKAARLDYLAALRMLRSNPDVHYNKAVNEMMMSEYRLAALDFTGAVRLRPDDKEAFFGRGVAKMQMYQYKAAVADFTRAIALDSLYADALEYRGISYASVDREKEARRDLQKAAQLNPEAQKSLRHYTTSLVQK
jgi:tetratricopeptide (TPR) repeat protein